MRPAHFAFHPSEPLPFDYIKIIFYNPLPFREAQSSLQNLTIDHNSAIHLLKRKLDLFS